MGCIETFEQIARTHFRRTYKIPQGEIRQKKKDTIHKSEKWSGAILPNVLCAVTNCTRVQSAVGRVLVRVGVGQGEQHRERVEGVLLGSPGYQLRQHAPERRRLEKRVLQGGRTGTSGPKKRNRSKSPKWLNFRAKTSLGRDFND